MKGALDQLVAEGGTAMGDGLERGLVAARTPVPDAAGTGVRRLPSVIVLLSDGKNTSGSRDPVDVAREAGRAKVPIFAIALGTPAGEVELRDSFGFLQRVQVPRSSQAGNRAGLRRSLPELGQLVHSSVSTWRDTNSERKAVAPPSGVRPTFT